MPIIPGVAAAGVAVSTPAKSTVSFHKLALIAGLALATTVPSFFVTGLIDEREARQAGVQQEFTRNWGPQQTLRAPILVIPYRRGSGSAVRYVKIAPTRLDIASILTPQERGRGLFRATVYRARENLHATFSVPSEAEVRSAVSETEARFLWTDAFVAIGASSLVGMTADDGAVVDGTKAPWRVCREVALVASDCPTWDVIVANAGLTASPDGVPRLALEGVIHLRGTGSLKLQSIAKDLDATASAPWSTPSFVGDMLPTTSDVTADHFEARWQSTDYAGPRIWATANLGEVGNVGTTLGVDLIEATPIYRMISRTAKYGLLLVVLSFATYLFFELLSPLKIHPVQYGLLGLSLSLFALLLLSLGEVIGYTPGFAASAGLVLLQSSIYTAAVARRVAPALVFAAMLAALFGFLYVLLSLETYSLLIGALALFAALSVMMALTQRVSWSDLGQARKS